MTYTSTSEGSSANPLISGSDQPYGTIPFSRITAQDMEEAVREGIRLQNQEIDAIVKQRSTPTFENTIMALDRSGEMLNRSILALSNLESANGNDDLMQAMANVTPLITDHSTEILLNSPLFKRIKFVYDNQDKETSLTSEDKRLIKKTYENFVTSGAGLTGSDRNKLKKLQSELSDLSVRFSQNVANGMKDPSARLWLTADQLDGVPESIKAAYRASAAEILKAENKQDDGSLYLVTLYRPSYSPFMTYASNRKLRKRLYEMYGSYTSSGKYDNNQILKDIANIRLEVARLLGKKNFAEYKLQDNMANTPEMVMDFLEDLNRNYTEPMRAEIAEIQVFARKTEGSDFTLQPWDYSYWSDKLKNERYAFSEEDMKPYFELNNTIGGVFGLATRLYGYKFKENVKIDKYHPDVKVYEVYDRKGDLLGILYADFYYREGKRPGAWMTEFRGESKDDNNVRTLPLISIVTNFSKPVGNEPVLLNTDEVNTFLHEFGHALHGLSSQVKHPALAGTNVKHDFVELFSQFNENYLTRKEFLDTFAKHYKTGKKMPQELIDKLIRSSQFGAAYATMRQLGFGYLDMAYHTITEPLRASASVKEFEEKALDPVRIFPIVEGYEISPSFSHIFDGGYAAGYYGYKWSEALDADAFAAFKENGVFDRKTADKFLKMLQSGDSVDPMDLYIEFRGKKPTNDALLERDGIKKL